MSTNLQRVCGGCSSGEHSSLCWRLTRPLQQGREGVSMAAGAPFPSQRARGPAGGLTRRFRCFTPNCTRLLPCLLPCATVDAFTTDGPMPTPLPRLVVGIPEDTRQRLRALAAAHHRNISGEVIAALESWIEKHSNRFTPSEAAAKQVIKAITDQRKPGGLLR